MADTVAAAGRAGAQLGLITRSSAGIVTPARYSVSVAIQAHPDRSALATGLAAELDAEIVWDPEPTALPSPWRTYRLALETTPAWATHRLVVQEDSVPCPGFVAVVTAAVAARPARALAFWHGGEPREHVSAILTAGWRRLPWARFDSYRWVPAVAACWPVSFILRLLAFVDAQRNWPPLLRADDEILGRALRSLGEPLLVSVPSLVEHPDTVPSLINHRRRHHSGADPGRVAACPLPPDCDPALIDWALGPE